ncbi:polysaccharide biosynthesis/export family protein [Solitalea lacus]|uniref:polysaccharide biosynthesis/export family protein n=1 Tax=Solitalea lacus TaxID=2911172 RepID=UPI001EDB5278|nr:polysaccharide biosynthesis/export family protein [Solitalea lacus]UKJ07080.1 polysaccharide biosynthesis/export family protein [Solitalea lacus]
MKFNFYKSFIVVFSFVTGMLATSCVSRKEVTYFQPASVETDLSKLDINNKFIAKIQPGDILAVLVSSLSPEASAMFNPFPAPANLNQQNNTVLTPATGFLVDQTGCITLPLAGKIKLDGLSTKEAGDFLTQKLNKFLVDPTVNVRIQNYKISVMGEVVRPSLYSIPNEKISLPEALSLAGDLTIYGKRQNILVIRERNGQREFGRVDLTNRDMFSSPYYYLQSGDIVYVEPSSSRVATSDRTYQLAPVIISALSLITVIITSIAK